MPLDRDECSLDLVRDKSLDRSREWERESDRDRERSRGREWCL
jgi:hypothetical protein